LAAFETLSPALKTLASLARVLTKSACPFFSHFAIMPPTTSGVPMTKLRTLPVRLQSFFNQQILLDHKESA
jgi:hypothetical protein